MNFHDIMQIECLVEFILNNFEYEDIDELIEKIGVDREWFEEFMPKEEEDE